MATGRQSEQEEERLVMEGLVAEMELRCRMPEEGLGTAQAGAPRDSMLLQQQQMQQQRVQLQQQQHDYSTTRPLPPVASPPLSPSRTHVFELT